MDIFRQNKLLFRVIAILILLNIVLMGLMLWRDGQKNSHGFPPNGPPPQEDKEALALILKKELGLSDTQMDEFKVLRTKFFIKEREIQHELRLQHDSMNAEMFREHTDTLLVKDIAQRISANEYQMELLRLQQALDLKKICTPEQMKQFEALIIEIRDYFKPGRPPHQRP